MAKWIRTALVLLLACSFANAPEARAQQLLTLACKGTAQSAIPDKNDPEPREPISMGIVLNFATHTIQGFDYPIMIRDANDATVVFGGNRQSLSLESIIEGYIDRVTEKLEATEVLFDHAASKTLSTKNYRLRCKPTQRLF